MATKIKPSPVVFRSKDTEKMRDLMTAATQQQDNSRPNTEEIQPSQNPAVGASLQASKELLSGVQPGRVLSLPIAVFRESEMNARVFYSTKDVDEVGQSIQDNGQDVPVLGYVDGHQVVLIDGQKRLRAARAFGIEALRVEITERPQSERDHYLQSRRINRERSSQTALDDAVRFKQLIASGQYANQTDLGADAGLSQSMVARILALNSMPELIMRRLRESHLTESVDALYSISQIFTQDGIDSDVAVETASSVIDEAVKQRLSGRQVIALVSRKLTGPRRRNRNEVRQVSIGRGTGQLKMNAEKGRLELSIKGLAAEEFEPLRLKIEALLTQA